MKLDAESNAIPPSKSQSWVSNLPIAQKRSAWRVKGWGSLSQFTDKPSYENRMLSREFQSRFTCVRDLVMSTAESRRSKSHCVGRQIEPAGLRLNIKFQIWSSYFPERQDPDHWRCEGRAESSGEFDFKNSHTRLTLFEPNNPVRSDIRK